MDDRIKTCLSFILVAAASATAGCSYSQQAKFQSFLPPAPTAADANEANPAPAPAVESNSYLQPVPAFLLSTTPEPRRKSTVDPLKSATDRLVTQADQSFQRGRNFYQQNDMVNARREFDSAIDLMLEAAAANPASRDEIERHMDEMADAIHRRDLAGLGASDSVEEGKFEKAPLEDILVMTFPVDPKLKDRVHEQVSATVSQLPLTVNDTVLGYINYFSKGGHNTIVAATQRSGRYRPMIQRILDEEGLPQELIHLAQAESGFIPRAMSRAAAGGMWQFLIWRGREYGLMQTPYSDDRMDPEKATRAAARHLHDLYSEFGDWYLAIAAYNCGPGVVEKAVERTGYADFWELRTRGVLPAETTNYVPIILAMTIMEKNAAAYGLDGITLDPPLEYDTIQTTTPTGLALISDITDAPLAELAELNPALLKGAAPASYALRVPKGTGSELTATLQMIPAEHRLSWRMHRVNPGETLASIGKQFGVLPAAIVAANNLKSGEDIEGDRLLIPAVPHVVRTPMHRTISHSASHRASAASHGVQATRTASSAPPPKTPVTVARAQ
jgi:membrane-bound lytic murein transglycosylase D